MNEYEIARRYLPCFLADEKEPFPVKRIGYRIWRADGISSSFQRKIELPEGTGLVIEYALYFDFDIQHLYDLEHAWIYVNPEGEIVNAESSNHGRYINAWALREPLVEGTHLCLYLQPGKHALVPRGELVQMFPDYLEVCDRLAGADGILVPERLEKKIVVPEGAGEAVEGYLQLHHRFTPTLLYHPIAGCEELLVDMEELWKEIPRRINGWIREIYGSLVHRNLIVFTDCGDTIVDESTQIISKEGDVLRADLIESAGETLTALYNSGYRIALVADGRTVSFSNIFRELGLGYLFEAWVISEEVGVEKPHSAMFETAMERMGLTHQDKKRIVMVGNNIKRDVLGANRMGMISVLLHFSPRYCMEPEGPEEEPDYRIAMPEELLGLFKRLEADSRKLPGHQEGSREA